MMKIRHIKIIVVLFVLILQSTLTHANDTTKVLLLNSYHQGYGWTDMITASIRAEFEKMEPIVQLSIEYMDSKHYQSPEYSEMLRKLYEYKYSNIEFDLIIVSDNFALDFIKLYREKLFSNIPIVFCGIDKYDESMNKGYPQITGVIEDYDLKQSIDLALKLHPRTKNIAVVCGSTSNGIVDIERFRSLAPYYQKEYKIIELVDWSWNELSERLENLPENTIVNRLSCTDSYKGIYKSGKDLARFWEKYCRFPTYTSMGHKVENGVLGGIITTGNLQGIAAVNLAKRILNGEPVAEIPVLHHSPSLPIFDYYQMKHFNIKASELPKNTIILNQPFSFYRQYKYLVWFVSAVVFFLTCLIIVLFVNIIRRREAQKALQENEKKYRLLIETVPNGILEMNTEGKFIFANTALLKMFGYKKDELIDISMLNFVPKELQKELKHDMKILFEKTPHPRTTNGKYLTKDNKILDVQLDWNYKRNAAGKVVGIISVVSDITQRLQSEKEAKLRQEQLIQADKMAALGTLVAGVAHEVNNPNNFIMLNVPTLARTWKSITPILDEYYKKNGDFKISAFSYSEMRKEFPEICSNILEGSHRIKTIVKNLKEYSRKSEYEKLEMVDINEMVGSCINLLGNNIKKYTHNFNVQFGRNLPQVKGNFQHFEQVVINLIQNACQALTKKDDEIIVRTSLNKSDDSIIIKIQDNGRGIKKENLSRIFDPFFTTKRGTGGTGLGLSVSNSIIQKYNGSLSYQSKPGEGATAIIRLPIPDLDKPEPTRKDQGRD